MQRLFMECAVRAALIAMGTAGVLRLLRVKSAGARHAAWAGVVALMLVLPAWMAWGPRATLQVLPAAHAPVYTAMPLLLATTVPATVQAHAAAPVAPLEHWNWLAIVYLAGVFVLLLRLGVGTLRAHILLRRAKLIDGQLTSAQCAAPITVGWLHPSIILPVLWRSWSTAQLDAVLTHEGQHVRRRDPLVQWLALLNRAIFWFHPLAWWLERRLSALAEEACDAAVIERGHDPRDYSGYLLELARAVGESGMRIRALGMAMPGSSLPRRIRQILASAPAPRLTRARALSLALACAAISVLAAANLDRQSCDCQPPVPPAPPAAPAPPSPMAPPAAMAAPAPMAPLAPMAPFAAVAPPAPPEPPVSFAAPTPPEASMDEFLPPPPPPDAPFPVAEPPSAPVPPPPPPVPQQIGNRMIVLYFDLDGTEDALQSRARAAAVKFVESQTRATDSIAIMSWSGGKVKVVQDFTGDRDRLLKSLENLETFATSDAGGQSGLMAAIRALAPIHHGNTRLIYLGAELKGMPVSDHSNVAVYKVYLGGPGDADRK